MEPAAGGGVVPVLPLGQVALIIWANVELTHCELMVPGFLQTTFG